jgi:hypothetical protein
MGWRCVCITDIMIRRYKRASGTTATSERGMLRPITTRIATREMRLGIIAIQYVSYLPRTAAIAKIFRNNEQ